MIAMSGRRPLEKMSGASWLKRLECDVPTQRTHNERIYVSVSWQRSDGAIPRGNAEIHAEMARLVQGAGRKGPHQVPWTSARARRQGRQGQAEERPRWPLCGGQGH